MVLYDRENHRHSPAMFLDFRHDAEKKKKKFSPSSAFRHRFLAISAIDILAILPSIFRHFAIYFSRKIDGENGDDPTPITA